MADLIKKIRTAKGDLQIDYNALANLPTISYKVDENGVLSVVLKQVGVEAGPYLHYIIVSEMYSSGDRLMLLVNNDSTDLSSVNPDEDTTAFAGAILCGLISGGAVVAYHATGGEADVGYLKLENVEVICDPYSFRDIVVNCNESVIINDTVYSIRKGMTWSEFVNENPNEGFYCEEDYVCCESFYYIYDHNGMECRVDDIIDTTKAYHGDFSSYSWTY